MMPTSESTFFLKAKANRRVPVFFCAESAATKELFVKLEALCLSRGLMTESAFLSTVKAWGIKGLKLDLVTSVVGFIATQNVDHASTEDQMEQRLAFLVAAQELRERLMCSTVEDFQAAFDQENSCQPWTHKHDLYRDVPDFRLLPKLKDSVEFRDTILRYNRDAFICLLKKARSVTFSGSSICDVSNLDFDELKQVFLTNKKASMDLTIRHQGEIVDLRLRHTDIRAVFA